MNILILSYEYPPIGGGGGVVVRELAIRFVQLHHDVRVLTMGMGTEIEQETVQGVHVVRLPVGRRNPTVARSTEMVRYLYSGYRWVQEYIRLHRPDAIHAHFIVPTGILAAFIRRRWSIPFVITAHGSDVPGHHPTKMAALHRWTPPAIARILISAEAVVMPSNYLASKLREMPFFPKKIALQVVPNGVDHNRFAPATKKPYALMITRLIRGKGLEEVVRAWTEAEFQIPLHIMGDGPLMPELRRLAEGLPGVIVFHGWMDNLSEDYRNWLAEAAVFLLPSARENSSMVLLEAMAAGCAVITSTAPGCAEMVGDTAVCVPHGQTEPIIAAVKGLMEQGGQSRTLDVERCEQLGIRARNRAIERYNWDQIAQQYLQLLTPKTNPR